ncbi:N-formyl peptide receptor 2-like [Molossus nigricans]
MEPGYTAPQIFTLIMQGITCVLGIGGNGLVIWVAGFRMARTVTTVCYLNLALADFFFTAAMPFIMVVNVMRGQWPYGSLLCKSLSFTIDTNLFGSVFLIAFIALDRCVCVLHPVWAQNYRTVRLAKKLIIVPWILALLLNLPILIFVTTSRDEEDNIYCGFNPHFWGNISEEQILQRIFTTSAIIGINRFVTGFTVPMSIIAVCHGLIAAKICNKGMANSSRPIRVLIAVMASFFICWFPFQLFLLLLTLYAREIDKGKYQLIPLLVHLTSTLAFFNSCLNPMLYVFLGRDFRKRLIHSLPASLERALTEDLASTSDTTTKSASSPTGAELQEM